MSFTNPYPASRLTLDATNSLSSGLVGFWPLTDGTGSTAKDITSNANDGTESGGVSWASTDIGAAASFDGVDDYFNCGQDASLDITGDVTITAWVKPDTVTGAGYIAAKASGSAFQYLIYRNNYNFRFGIGNSSAAIQVVTAGSITLGQWYFVVGKLSSTTMSIECYAEDGTSSSNSASITGTGIDTVAIDVNIGARANGANLFDGNIQNVRVYNRALSATEVATLYNRPWEGTNYGDLWPYSPPAPADAVLSTDTAATNLMSGCQAWWLLTDGSGSTATDITTGGNDIGFVTAGWSAESIGTCLDAVSTSTTTSTTLNHPAADVSYSLWIKGDTSSLTGLIDGRSTLGGLNGTRVDLSSRKLKMLVDSSAGFLNTAISTTDVTPFGGGGWFHAACTWDGVDVKIYVNGSLETTVAHGGTLSSLESYNVNTPTTGELEIQNVRIWNRALTADEITLLYERPFEGITYGDAFHYDPPTPANLTPLDNSSGINTDCVGWWPLTETDDYASGAADISGNGNTLTKAGTVTSEPAILGTVGEFDGSTGELEYTGTMTDFESLTGSASFWFKIPSTTSNTVHIPFSVHKTNQLTDYLSFYIGSATGIYADESISVGHTWGGSASYKVRASYRMGHAYFHDDKWHHCAWTMGTSSNAMYIDGVQVGLSYATGSASTGNEWIYSGVVNSVTVGARDYSASPVRLDGQVSNVRVWNRALSAAEVWSIYTNPWLGSAYSDAAAVIYNYILRSKRFRRL